MIEKDKRNQPLARRSPVQARSQQKVELMLEAAMQLLDRGDLHALTTNAVAAKAGVSIGTLYQYFHDKQALLDALLAREMAAMSDKVLGALTVEVPHAPGDRIRHVVRAVVGAYGGRGKVHRMLMGYALSRPPGRRLSPLFAQLMELFTSGGVAGPGQKAPKLTPAQSFVLLHAATGVLRTLAASEDAPPLPEVEDALVQLLSGYVKDA